MLGCKWCKVESGGILRQNCNCRMSDLIGFGKNPSPTLIRDIRPKNSI